MAENTEQYTPDDAQVRSAYVRAMRNAFIASAGEHGEEFDRFITAHDARVKAEARKGAFREAARYFAGGLHCADMRTTPEETVRHLTRMADDEQEH